MAQRTRVTLTKAQAESPTGRALIQAILDMCHDGELTMEEIEHFHISLRTADDTIPAVQVLRALTRAVVADGIIDPVEAYDLKCHFERVLPKEIRGIVTTHLESIGAPPRAERKQDDWRSDPATIRQIEYIIALGGSTAAGMSKGQASDLIEELLLARPPTPRQMMLIRFFDRLDLARSTKEQVSLWIDQVFIHQPSHERAWDRFKIETGRDPASLDYELVPIGAYRQYLREQSAGTTPTATPPVPKELKPTRQVNYWMFVWIAMGLMVLVVVVLISSSAFR